MMIIYFLQKLIILSFIVSKLFSNENKKNFNKTKNPIHAERKARR